MADPTAKQSLMGLDVNYAASNQWFCYLPLENILGKKFNDLDLHVTRFSLPQMVQSSTTVSYKGYQKEIPTKVINADTKELTLEYIVDEDWQNYRSLYSWMSKVEGTLNPVTTDDNTEAISPDDYLTLRIYLLNNDKKKVIQFAFYNCWIKVFNEIALESNNPNEVHASFTFAYDDYRIEDI